MLRNLFVFIKAEYLFLRSQKYSLRVTILIWDFLNGIVQFWGLYRDIKQGISSGWSLPKLIGVLFLKLIDDWIVLSPNRWKLKMAIQIVNQTLNKLKVEKHPVKIYIGRIAKGCDVWC
jgi:RNA-directed DNA polymerase